jgi:hypothetical protein
MRVYLKNPDAFFAWLDEKGYRYAVLRGFRNMGENPRCGGKDDVDILVEDRAVGPLAQYCRGVPKRAGLKCDIYSAGGGLGADFVGHAYFPKALACAVLENRVRWQDSFYVPCDRDLYDSLLFHLAYQKAEGCLADATDPTAFRAYKRYAFIKALAERLGLPYDLSLLEMHRLLRARGYGIDQGRLASYLQNQFKRLFKSRFYALLLALESPGELNLFVLRAKAVRRGFRQAMLDEIARHYTLLAVKDIPWRTRLTKAKYMRGNKWRWGGWPVVAVAVFDPAPLWRTEEERAKEHPLVFSSRQFFKRELRDWVVKEGRLYHKDNALHSTDNEAEAVGHFDLFFSPEEERALYARAEALRVELRRAGCRGFNWEQGPSHPCCGDRSVPAPEG